MATTYPGLIHSARGGGESACSVSRETAERPATKLQSLIRRAAKGPSNIRRSNVMTRRELELARLVNDRLAPAAD